MNLLQIITDALDPCKTETSLEKVQEHCKRVLEKPIFDELRRNYLPFLKSWFSTYILPDYVHTNKVLFLYETRCHENLEFLLYSSIYFAQGWGLHIVCSETNKEFILEILKHNANAAYIQVLDETGVGYVENRNSYNAFMKTPAFWNSFPESKHWILTIEVDSYLRKPIPIEALNYSYCGACWAWKDGPGGGGITLRSIQAMKDICARFPTLADEIWPQDCWAAEGIRQLGYSYNSTFFMESCLQVDAIGVHQWWTFCLPLDDERLWYLNEYMKLDIKELNCP
jgi:hypothetical protein